MESGFRRIFWGILFIYIEIKIGQFDILPNFIGAYFIYSGCNRLKYTENSFNKVINVAKLFIGLELIYTLVVLVMPFTNNSSMWQSIIMTFGGLCLNIINFYILYYICKGIYNIAAENDFKILMDKAKFRWKLSVYTFILLQMFTPFIYNIESLIITIPITIFTLIQFVASILILTLISTAKKELVQFE